MEEDDQRRQWWRNCRRIGEENVEIGEDEGFLDYGFWACVGI